MHFKIHVCTKSNLYITTWISFFTNSLYTFLGQKYSTRSILHLIQRWIFSMICWIAFINKKMKQITTISCEYNQVCVLPMDCDVVTTSLTYEKKYYFVTIFAFFDNLINLELFCNYDFPIFVYNSYTCSSIYAFSI